MTIKHHFRNATVRLIAGLALALCAVTLSQSARSSNFPQGNGDLNNFLLKLSQLFPLADSSQHIFTVNSVYVLQPLFDKSGALTEIRILPKYYFNETHHDWGEPDKPPFLDESEYRHLLSQIEQVSPLGQQKRNDPGSTFITNDQYPAIDEYEKCIINRSMRSKRGLPDAATFPVVSARIYFFHLVSGHLDSFSKPNPPHDFAQFCGVRIEEKFYWISRKDCRSSKRGRQISVMAAGPPDET
jgi:hypothetical protein